MEVSMGLFSNKEPCSVCGEKCGLIRFSLKDGGWCCKKCFKKTKLSQGYMLNVMKAENVKQLVQEKNNEEANVSGNTYFSAQSKSRKEIPEIVPFLLIAIFLSAVLALVLSFSSSDNQSSSDHPFHKNNIAVMKTVFDKNLAKKMVFAFEETGAIGDSFEMQSEDILSYTNNEYDIYMGLTVRVFVDGENFKFYTYEEQYDSETAILLYDSTNKESTKVLSKTEQESFEESQRKYLVKSTIQITPSTGILLHNSLGGTQLSFVVKNLSTDKIDNVAITFIPWFPGYEANHKGGTYYTYQSLTSGQSKEFNITAKDWSNYDYYKITQVIVYFSDGTAIKFNRYDCQFL